MKCLRVSLQRGGTLALTGILGSQDSERRVCVFVHRAHEAKMLSGPANGPGTLTSPNFRVRPPLSKSDETLRQEPTTRLRGKCAIVFKETTRSRQKRRREKEEEKEKTKKQSQKSRRRKEKEEVEKKHKRRRRRRRKKGKKLIRNKREK